MLTFLKVKNFAIIDSLETELAPGLNMLTGETGAGKSIIIKALNLLQGDRASAEDIRKNETEAEIQALFVSTHPDLQKLLAEHELINPEEPTEIMIRRVIKKDGNKVFVNGHLVNLSLLSAVAPYLFSICAQHSQKELVDPHSQLKMLDTQTDRKILAQLAATFQKHRQLQKSKMDLEIDEDYKRERIEFLSYQVQEINELNPQPGEIEALQAEERKMQGLKDLSQTCQEAESVLYGDNGIIGALEGLIKQVRQGLKFDAALNEPQAQLDKSLKDLEGVGKFFSQYVKKMNLDDEDTGRVVERIESLNRMIRKHGGTLESMLAKREKLQQELTSLQNRDQELKTIEQELAQTLKVYHGLAKTVHDQRVKQANRLNKEITKQLQALAMKGAQFEIQVTAQSTLSEQGSDRVEFMIAPNTGEGLKSLAKIASGGELSRVMLALHRVITQNQSAHTFIFDEIDTGIGGDVGGVIGAQLREMAKVHQVICITHLPQVAVHGHHHWVIAKAEVKNRTQSTLTKIEGSARVAEVARMLGGSLARTRALEHAEALLAAVAE